MIKKRANNWFLQCHNSHYCIGIWSLFDHWNCFCAIIVNNELACHGKTTSGSH